MRKLYLLFLILLSQNVLAASNVNVFSYASSNVTTSAYTVLLKSTTTSASHLEICDTSAHLLKIATGATGSEVDVATTTVSGCVLIPIYLPIGTQLSIKAIDATASTGFNTVAFL